MIPASDAYRACEAMKIGATPVARATFLPYPWPNGINADGDFVHCAYVAPDLIQADYEGFSGGSWVSPVVTSNLQIPSSSGVLSWEGNSPGFDVVLYWRGADNLTDLSAASWTLVNQGDTIQITPYYQFMLTLEGYRAWAVDGIGDADDFTAWAEDSPGTLDAYQGYAADVNVPGDVLTYISLELLGEFTATRDIEQAGTVTLEAPKAFDDLVAGAYSGLSLNNRQGAFDEALAWTPAPLFSPNKSSFLFAQQMAAYANEGEFWEKAAIKLRIDMGWAKGASFSINAAGTGYAPGQLLTVVQASASGMVLRVLTITGGGATGPVGTATIMAQGRGYSVATGLFTTGSGTGFKINLLVINDFTEFITLFLGKIKKWGPVNRAVDQDGVAQSTTVEVYAVDYIADCLQKRIALPADDGSSNPLTLGEFIVEAQEVSGWTPAPEIKEANFGYNNLKELDVNVQTGGGSLSVISPGLRSTSNYAMRAASTGANQSNYGGLTLPTNGEIFVTGYCRFTTVPGTIAYSNARIWEIVDSLGSSLLYIYADVDGSLWIRHPGGGMDIQLLFNILAYEGVPLTWAIWLSDVIYTYPSSQCYFKMWINDQEVCAHTVISTDSHPRTVRFGVQTQSVAESWDIDFDDVLLYDTYYNNAFQVQGYPFADISDVYVKDTRQSDSYQAIPPDPPGGSMLTVTLNKYPAYGLVVFDAAYTNSGEKQPAYKISDTVMIRVVEHAGGRHPAEMISMLLAEAGLTDFIDAAALAAALATNPDDRFFTRFEGGGSRDRFSLPDFASLGMPIADALKEITSRALYWIFVDAGLIKIVPYTGTPPSSPSLAFTASNLRECDQTIDLESMNAFVTAIYGWYKRDSSLWYAAGNQSAGGQGTGMDYSWDSPVACEDRSVVVAKVDLLLKFLSAQERLEPVRTNLAGARLELIEAVSVDDVLLGDVAKNYLVTRKEIGLDPGSRETNLQLMRFLGE